MTRCSDWQAIEISREYGRVVWALSTSLVSGMGEPKRRSLLMRASAEQESERGEQDAPGPRSIMPVEQCWNEARLRYRVVGDSRELCEA